MTRTDAKIVCTLGPASDDRETLETRGRRDVRGPAEREPRDDG